MLYETLHTIAGWPGLYHARRAYYRYAFFHQNHRRAGRFWGAYDSYAEAQAEAKRRFGKADYNHPAIVGNSIEMFLATNLFDWPAIYHLDLAIRRDGAMSVADIGGHIGVKYYAFRSWLDMPQDFRWHVVDVASMIEAGDERRVDLGAGDELKFHGNVSDVGHVDVLFLSGALQYLDADLGSLITALGKPRTVLLNKIPIGTVGFHTLDNLGHARVPYRIFAQGELENKLEGLGYRLVNRWGIPERGFTIPYLRHGAGVSMAGMAWAS